MPCLLLLEWKQVGGMPRSSSKFQQLNIGGVIRLLENPTG